MGVLVGLFLATAVRSVRADTRPALPRIDAGSATRAPGTLDPTKRTLLDMATGLSVRADPPRNGGPTRDSREGAMLREVRSVRLAPGRHVLVWSDLPGTAVLETLAVRLASAPPGARVLAQRVDRTELNANALEALVRAAAPSVTPLDAPSRAKADAPEPADASERAGAREPMPLGTAVVSLAHGLVLRVGDELTVIPQARVAVPAAPKRTLTLEIEVPGAATAAPSDIAVEVTLLLLDVVQETPWYTLRFDTEDPAHGHLTGAALVTNLSGYGLEGARAYLHLPSDDMSEPSGFDGTRGLADTRTADERRFPPFAVNPALAFRGGSEASTTFVDTPVVAREGRRIDLDPDVFFSEQTRDGFSERLSSIRTFALEGNGLGATRALPPGNAFIWRASHASQLVERASLTQDESTIEVAIADERVALLGRQRALRAPSGCRKRATWRIAIARYLLELGPVDLRLPAPNATVTVAVRGHKEIRTRREGAYAIVRVPAAAELKMVARDVDAEFDAFDLDLNLESCR